MPSPDQIFHALKRSPCDRELWIQFYDVIEPRLSRFSGFLAGRFGYVDDSADIVQDVLLRLIEDFPKITRPMHTFAHLQSYLFRACRNGLIDHARRRQTVATAEEVLRIRFEDMVSETFRREFEKAENRQYLSELLSSSSPSCKELVQTYLLSEQSLADYAESRRIPLGTIYKQWSRCIEEIRKKIASPVRNLPPET